MIDPPGDGNQENSGLREGLNKMRVEEAFIRDVRENATRLQRQYKLSRTAAIHESFEALAGRDSAASSADPLPSEPEPGFEWRLHRVPPYPPGGHGSWVETNHPAVVACMGSVPECAENGCQARIIRKEAAADPALRTLRWQSIESAPKDGRAILARVPQWVPPLVGMFNKHGEFLTIPGKYSYKPTHWMPLPAADLDRVCPEIREAQTESPTDPV